MAGAGAGAADLVIICEPEEAVGEGNVELVNDEHPNGNYLEGSQVVCSPHGIPVTDHDFRSHLQGNTPLNDRILAGHTACLVQAYIRDHPYDTKICMSFGPLFCLQLESFYGSRHKRRRGAVDVAGPGAAGAAGASGAVATVAGAGAGDGAGGTVLDVTSTALQTFVSHATLPPMTDAHMVGIIITDVELVLCPVLVDISVWALLVYCFRRKVCFFFCGDVLRSHRAAQRLIHPARHAFAKFNDFFKALWGIDPSEWSLVDICPPPPHQDVFGVHVHCMLSCGVNVLQVMHFLLRNFRECRTRQLLSDDIDHPPLEVGYPPVCVCDQYRNVIRKTLRTGTLPAECL